MTRGWLQGTWAGKPVAVKVYNLRQDGAVASYRREKVAYQGLKALQGIIMPYFCAAACWRTLVRRSLCCPMRGQP